MGGGGCGVGSCGVKDLEEVDGVSMVIVLVVLDLDGGARVSVVVVVVSVMVLEVVMGAVVVLRYQSF